MVSVDGVELGTAGHGEGEDARGGSLRGSPARLSPSGRSLTVSRPLAGALLGQTSQPANYPSTGRVPRPTSFTSTPSRRWGRASSTRGSASPWRRRRGSRGVPSPFLSLRSRREYLPAAVQAGHNLPGAREPESDLIACLEKMGARILSPASHELIIHPTSLSPCRTASWQTATQGTLIMLTMATGCAPPASRPEEVPSLPGDARLCRGALDRRAEGLSAARNTPRGVDLRHDRPHPRFPTDWQQPGHPLARPGTHTIHETIYEARSPTSPSPGDGRLH